MDFDVKLLSAELSGLWLQFLEMFRGCPRVEAHLASEFHQLRVSWGLTGGWGGVSLASRLNWRVRVSQRTNLCCVLVKYFLIE